jgi:hypothetical protein
VPANAIAQPLKEKLSACAPGDQINLWTDEFNEFWIPLFCDKAVNKLRQEWQLTLADRFPPQDCCHE